MAWVTAALPHHQKLHGQRSTDGAGDRLWFWTFQFQFLPNPRYAFSARLAAVCSNLPSKRFLGPSTALGGGPPVLDPLARRSGKSIDNIIQRQAVEFALHARFLVALAFLPVKREKMGYVFVKQLFLIIGHLTTTVIPCKLASSLLRNVERRSFKNSHPIPRSVVRGNTKQRRPQPA